VAGCDGIAIARGWCDKCYSRWRANGDPAVCKQIKNGDHEARFLSHVDRRGDDECWPWKSGTGGGGYAIFTINGKSLRAHRWAYEHFVGPIPPGLTIDHVKASGCTRRDCVNWVSHLEPVTQGENTLRGDGPSARNKRKTHCKYGHEFTPENTYMEGNRRRCKQCGRDKALKWYYDHKAA
jgi:hypothetical protein